MRLWWPRGHGERHGYRLTVRGQWDSDVVIEAESKVRGHALSPLPPTVMCLNPVNNGIHDSPLDVSHSASLP